MYCNHYGFSEKPFDVTPDPRFLYLTTDHRETLASLIYGIQERRGFIVVVGEVGTGKTTLLNAALDRLDDKTKVAFIFNTDVTFNEILSIALYEWGLVKPKEKLSKTNAIQRLNNFAIQQLVKGGNVVLIVDEAQNLDNSVMEKLRLLSNLETQKHKLVQIVLSGQPELDIKLDQYELRQFAQRISLRRYIFPLSEKNTYAYIQHRLTFAKNSGASLFSTKAQKLIWEYSSGIPRKINVLCDNALLIGYGLKKKKIQAVVVEEAAGDLKWSRFSDIKAALNFPSTETESPFFEKKPKRRTFVVTATIIMAIFFFIGSYFLRGTELRFSSIVNLLNYSKNVAAEKIQPNLEKQKIQLPFSEIPAQNSIVPEIVNEDVSKKVKPDSFIEDEKSSNFSLSKSLVKDEEKLGSNVSVKEDKIMREKKIKSGDSLSRIIIQTYGKFNNVILDEVMKENPEVINPDLIFEGQVIKIPLNIKPM